MNRILLADDDGGLRSALGLLLETRLGASIVGEASSMEMLLAEAEQCRPTVVVLDWELLGMPGSGCLEAVRAAAPGARIFISSVRPEVMRLAQAARADGFINKSDPPELILRVFQQALNTHV